MSHRLDEVRSFVWWTAPLYAVFLGIGLVETHYTLTLALAALVAVLAAFGLLDGLILTNVQALRVQLARRPDDLATTRARLERLSRNVLVGGAALGAVGLGAVLLFALT